MTLLLHKKDIKRTQLFHNLTLGRRFTVRSRDSLNPRDLCLSFATALKCYIVTCVSAAMSNLNAMWKFNHWGRVTHICVGKLAIIGSDNGLPPGRRQAILWTNAGILLVGPLGTYFNEILIGIQTFSLKKMHLKMSSAKWHSLCLGLNVLTCNRCFDAVSSLWASNVIWLHRSDPRLAQYGNVQCPVSI